MGHASCLGRGDLKGFNAHFISVKTENMKLQSEFTFFRFLDEILYAHSPTMDEQKIAMYTSYKNLTTMYPPPNQMVSAF